jgi:MFS family permease
LFLDFGLTLDQFAVLNAIWAATIVLFEVPSGALADVIGRRNLLVTAGALMVGEILIICLAPVGSSPTLFWLFALNRVLSGLAEAAASGADEALAYDSLCQHGIEGQWSRVLERQMRLQSAANLMAMSVGAVLYDPAAVNWLLSAVGATAAVGQEATLKFPLYLTLAMAVITLAAAVGMTETQHLDRHTDASRVRVAADAFKITLDAGAWILRTPMASVIIASGLLFDHVGRLLITLNSQYYRVIQLPEATFGMISSGLSVFGIFLPKIARWLTRHLAPGANFLLLGVLLFTGIIIMVFFLPLIGILAPVCIFSVLMLTNFFTSHYLNPLTTSTQRATVLSFKGLSFNLAYGLIGLLYASLLAHLRDGLTPSGFPAGNGVEEAVFRQSIQWFPGYFLIGFCLLALWIRWRLKDRR